MLKIEHLTKIYPNGKRAVNDLSLTIQAGDIYGFIGANGAGKTSTIKAAVGIHEFDQGEIYINGKSIRKDPLQCKKELAYIPDNPELWLMNQGGYNSCPLFHSVGIRCNYISQTGIHLKKFTIFLNLLLSVR